MKKYTLIIIIVLSFLSIGLGGYVFYDLVLTSDDKCAPIIENSNTNNNENLKDEVNDNTNQSNNSNDSGLNHDAYFDIENISKIKFGFSALGPNYRKETIVENKEIVKNIILEFDKLTFKKFAPYGVGLEGNYIQIVYVDDSIIEIFGSTGNEMVILDSRERDFENKVLRNSVIVELVNGLSFEQIYNKYYK